MDIHLTSDAASDGERAAVDALLGAPTSGWEGGERREGDGHFATGGYHRAATQRHLLLPALHAVQDAVGWIGEGALGYICLRLGVPPAEAYGVATFYALLSTTPRPGRVAHVCDDIVCGPRGGDAIVAGLGDRDDVVSSPCLGQCDRAPAVLFQQTRGGHVAVAPVTIDSVRDALDGVDPVGAPAVVGVVPQHGDPDLRLLRRIGVVDAADLGAYRAAGGYRALATAIEVGPQAVIDEITRSGLRGRGGAAFPTGAKWQAVADTGATTRYLVANADESEPGTFKDRLLMEGDPFALVESMTIAGLAVGARHGVLYIRGEYPLAEHRLRCALDAVRGAGLLGDDVMRSGAVFDIEIRRGAGAYICGEETALFESIEGYRGEPRQKPPFPTQAGLFGAPTVVNNVETLLNVPHILTEGADAYAELGVAGSTGPKLFCLAGAVARPGVYEVEFGATIGELLEHAGGVIGDLVAVLVGGAAGTFVGPDRLDAPLTFGAARETGIGVGSGVVMPVAAGADVPGLLRRIAAFFRDESCGQCVPCRVGTVRQEEALHRIAAGAPMGRELVILDDLDRAMRDSSICGLGHTAGAAVQSAIRLGMLDGAA